MDTNSIWTTYCLEGFRVRPLRPCARQGFILTKRGSWIFKTIRDSNSLTPSNIFVKENSTNRFGEVERCGRGSISNRNTAKLDPAYDHFQLVRFKYKVRVSTKGNGVLY